MKSMKPATLAFVSGVLIAACGSASTPADQQTDHDQLPAPVTTMNET